MADKLPHLKIDSFFDAKVYVYPKEGRGPKFIVTDRNRAIHGRRILEQLNAIKDQFAINREVEIPVNLVRDDVVYIEFISEWNFELKFDSFNTDSKKLKFQLLHVRKEKIVEDGKEKERFHVLVVMKEGGVSSFIKKAKEYLTINILDRKTKEDTGVPRNQDLISNIQNIQVASLRSFWTDEPEIPFPGLDENVWWEAWFRKNENHIACIDNVTNNLISIGAQIGQQTLSFPEHVVKLVKGTAKQLSGSLVLLDCLSELRQPKEINDFFTGKQIDFAEKQQWVDDLLARTEYAMDASSVVVCLLDTGLNNKHPLLEKAVPDNHLYTYRENWGKEDSFEPGGHGTGMSGIVLYGDITDVLASSGSFKIYHGIESFKIFHEPTPNDPHLYGSLTEYACNAPVVDFPERQRIYCLAITDCKLLFEGRPSTWSSSIDKIAFGRNGQEAPQLFIISGGNVNYFLPQANPKDYPLKNKNSSIHDPGQSFNALTVGSYTRMDRIDQGIWPGITALAPYGGMSPSNSTSIYWDSIWPLKPDIVMEGGNIAVQGTTLRDDVHSLKPLSLDKDFNKFLLYPFGDTSGAAALASKLAAELKTAYPDFWPETIRALMVHSAEWTAPMLGGVDLTFASVSQKREILRTYGYGVPIKEKAFYSARNSLTLIAENILQPCIIDGSAVKYKDYHLYELPWPIEVLQKELSDKDVKVIVTLSYFIDPNPGNRNYANNFSYYSHALDFKMIGPTEPRGEFYRRISGAEENQNSAFHGNDEPWTLKEACRNKGSIKKDFLISSGADLAMRNLIAVYPKKGWYHTRKRLNLMNSKVRYSLIISIETEEQNVEIYNPVMDLITNSLPST